VEEYARRRIPFKASEELIKQGVYSKEDIPQTELRTAQMGNDAGIIGAAMLGKEC